MYISAMDTTTLIYILGLLSAASLVMAWFDSGLPIHIFEFLDKIELLPAMNEDSWTEMLSWQDWADRANINLPAFLGELLTCRVCFSFHMSFWVGVASLFLPGAQSLPLLYPVITALTWPILINKFSIKNH